MNYNIQGNEYTLQLISRSGNHEKKSVNITFKKNHSTLNEAKRY